MEDKSPISILLGNRVRLAFVNGNQYDVDGDGPYINSEKEKFKGSEFTMFERIIPIYPTPMFQGSTLTKAIIIHEGEILFFSETHYKGDIYHIKRGKKDKKVIEFEKIEKIKSYIAGKNTIFSKNKIKLYTNTLPEVNWKKITYVEIEVLSNTLIPENDKNCIITFSEPLFQSKEVEAKKETDKDKSDYQEFNKVCYSADLKNDDEKDGYYSDEVFQKDAGKKIKFDSAIIGSKTTLVMFAGKYYSKSAYPVTNFIATKNGYFEKKDFWKGYESLESMMFLERGCILLFMGTNFRSDNFKFCSSLDNIEAAWLGNNMIRSFIIDKYLEVEFFEEVGFKGKSVRFVGSTRNVWLLSGMDFKSFKIYTKNYSEIRLNDPNFEIPQGCFKLYTENREKSYFNCGHYVKNS